MLKPTKYIDLVGRVNNKMLRHMLEELQDAVNIGAGDYSITICSTGGDAKIGLAIAGLIKTIDLPVTTYAFGTIESAAVLIFAAGGTRRMSRMAWAMIHESSAEHDGNSSSMVSAAQQMEREDRHWNKFMEEFTGTPEYEWAKLDEAETYLDAEECLKLKLATELI